MSISGVSSCVGVYRNQFQQISKDFSDLKADLASGDITTAREAYETLTQDLQNVRQARGIDSGADSTINKDLAAIGSALESGDLEGAQSAFATLTQDLQGSQRTWGGQRAYGAYGRYHHHHHEGSSQSVGTSIGANLAAIGSALQSGDLEGAQSAFAKLAQDLTNSSAQNTAGTSGRSTFSMSITLVNISIAA
jgi:hypothetical protein